MPRLVPVDYRVLVKFFERRGFRFDRQEGDHLIYVKPGTKRPIVIPTYRAVPVFIIQNNLHSAGIKRGEFLDFLGRRP